MRWTSVAWVGLAACSFTPGMGAPTDATTPDVPEIDALDQTTGWSTPVELTELSDPAGADDPSLTDDQLEIYFGSRRTGSLSAAEDIWFAKRNTTSEPFGAPVNVLALNTTYSETTMKITGDGLTIFFASNRLGGTFDLFYSTRVDRDSVWSTPLHVDELSSADGNWAAYAQTNLRNIVFCSGATEPQEALYASERSDSALPWGAPVKIAELDEPNISECDPMTPHPRAIYYGTDYLSSNGTFDIYRAARSSATTPYGSRTAITDVNLPAYNDRDPWVSADEKTMVFSSDRNGMIDALYITTR